MSALILISKLQPALAIPEFHIQPHLAPELECVSVRNAQLARA